MLRGGVIGIALTAVAVLAPGASAATFTVDTTNDLLDANQVDGICAAANGKCSLRAATMAANGNPGLDEIIVPAGIYRLTKPPNDPTSFEGDLDLDEAVTIDGAGPQATIIKQTVADRVIKTNATPAGLVPGALITDLTITGGRLPGEGNKLGGGIFVESFLLGIDNVTIRDNEITGPSANSFGGGIAALAEGTLVIQGSRIRGNVVDIRNATASAVGGGVFADGDFDPGSLVSTISDTVVENNLARVRGGGRGTGGGVYFRDPVTITRSEIMGNEAVEGGGLTLTQSLESADLTDVTIHGNRGMEGAGVNISTDDAVSMMNTTISENVLIPGQGRAGGALHSTVADLTLRHVTIADNDSANKRAIWLRPILAGAVDLDLTGSVIHGVGLDCRLGGVEYTTDLNVFGDTSCAPPGLSTNVVALPNLKPLSPNPGAFSGTNHYGPTHRPKPNSPAIGFVTTGCPPPSQDQLGFPRSAPCDAGAVER
jgi:hypothetical protein